MSDNYYGNDIDYGFMDPRNFYRFKGFRYKVCPYCGEKVVRIEGDSFPFVCSGCGTMWSEGFHREWYWERHVNEREFAERQRRYDEIVGNVSNDVKACDHWDASRCTCEGIRSVYWFPYPGNFYGVISVR